MCTLNFAQKKNNDIIMKVAVKPNSKIRDLLYDPINPFLLIFLNSPPDKGKANKELIKFLAGLFKISSSKITIVSGHTSREKTIIIKDYPLEQIIQEITIYKNKRK